MPRSLPGLPGATVAWVRGIALALSFAVALAFVALGACGTTAATEEHGPATSPVPANLERGAALFSRHCVLCHGHSGGGDGPAASYLMPKPRAFAFGSFNLVSTDNSVPSDDDLVRVMKRGMPGSSMPSWAWLPEEDLRQLAGYVRHLAVEGIAAHTQAAAMLRGHDLSEARAREMAAASMSPGAVMDVGEPAKATEATVTLGKRLYGEHCAACHGADGGGRRPVRAWPEHSRFVWTRNFTAGILRGGSSHRDIAWRILAGMPASGMPPTQLEHDELAALVAYVRTLIPQGADTRFVRLRRTIHVQRVSGALPADADDARWQPVRVVLAPLSWRDDAVFEADLAMLHNGSDIAVLVRWRDDTQDDRPEVGLGFSDGVAIQFSADAEPPMLAMGSSRHPVNIWHWKPFRRGDVEGFLDLVERPPHKLMDPRNDVQVDLPVYRPAPVSKAHAVRGTGLPNAKEFAAAGLEIHAQPRWRRGVWEVIFRRPLRPASGRDMTFRPGGRGHVACAVWNGSAQSWHGQKSVSVWHVLEID